MSKKKATTARPRLEVVNIKITTRDRRAIQARANKFAHGNLSAWLRHCGLWYAPRAKLPAKPYK